MRLPPVKKLTRAQARKYHQAIEVVYPEVLKHARGEEVQARKPTKHEQELERAKLDGYRDGIQEGRSAVERVTKAKDAEFAQHRKALHLDTLRTIRDLASAYGQMMSEISRAMQSEKDQL